MKLDQVGNESFAMPVRHLACLKPPFIFVSQEYLIISQALKSHYSVPLGHRRKEKRVTGGVSICDWSSRARKWCEHEVDRKQLVIPGENAPTMPGSIEPLDRVSYSVQKAGIAALCPMIRTCADDNLFVDGSSPLHEVISSIAHHGDSRPSAQMRDWLRGTRDVRGLCFGDDQSQRTIFRIHRQMQFRTQSVRGVSESLRPAFSRPQVESWYPRTIVESIRMCSISVLIAKASATRGDTRLVRQREKRRYVLPHRPKAAGRSRHRFPTQAVLGTVWRNRRLLDAVRFHTLSLSLSLGSPLNNARTIRHAGEKRRTYAHFYL